MFPFGQPVSFPYNHRSQGAIKIPINSFDDPNYGALIHIDHTIGNFELFVSFDQHAPPFYKHNYHYYHTTTSSLPKIERYQTNPTTGVIECYSTGTSFDIIIWHEDSQYKRFSYTDLYLDIKVDVGPDQQGATLTVSQPQFFKSEKDLLPYQSQYITLKHNSSNSNPTDSTATTSMNDSSYTIPQTLLDMYEDYAMGDDDDDNNNIGTTTNTNADFDEFDEFAEFEEKEQHNQSKTIEVPDNCTLCDTCREIIPKAQFTQHHAHCSQRYQFCIECDKPILKSLQHIHCPTCQMPSTELFLPMHDRLYHQELTCQCRPLLVKQHLALGFKPDTFKKETYSYTKIATHLSTTCPCREEKCPHCLNWFKMFNLEDHIKLCKREEVRCEYCDITVQKAALKTHYTIQHDFNPLQPLPDVTAWREQFLYSDTSAELRPNQLPGVSTALLRGGTQFNQRTRGSGNNGGDNAEDEVERQVKIRLVAMGIDNPTNAVEKEIANDVRAQVLSEMFGGW